MTSRRTRARLVQRLREAGVADERVLSALGEVPRHAFVDEALASRAYEDTALPIGHGQTISQPLVVARMTEALLGGGTLGKVLEIGTGSGYQTAVLVRVASQVFSVERYGPLLAQARARLAALQVRNVQLRVGDGFDGWPQEAPYDGILLAAAPREIPSALLEQLADGGRMILPVGEGDTQELVLILRRGEEFEQQRMGRVRFVPMQAQVVR
ncbi:protein-L-isoaspartate(D-aspartate) O-methyltransferase [Ectothiorhodospiraceae bacterium 2226]|nr:protein-L-isoaspartate(D-aspartate) O-methyltransferase [Ectothiorhodospiraceae bacterium 2226]